jgi:hypothetical protein|tara:strand:- start:11 stop:286 length:276 start_codon:yes stop_codon:yes gene_type:complete
MYIYNNPKPTLAPMREGFTINEVKMIKIIDITELSDLNVGDYFKLSLEAKRIYIKGEYLKEDKRFRCEDAEDISRERFLKPDSVVFTAFEY